MKQYLDLANKVLKEGIERPDITGTGILSIFGFNYDDFKITGYDPHPALRGAIAV